MLHEPCPVEHALPDDLETDDVCAFLKDVCGGRWHGSREDSSDVGMVSTRGSEEDNLVRVRVEDGADDGYVGEMAGRNIRNESCEGEIMMGRRTSRLHVVSSS